MLRRTAPKGPAVRRGFASGVTASAVVLALAVVLNGCGAPQGTTCLGRLKVPSISIEARCHVGGGVMQAALDEQAGIFVSGTYNRDGFQPGGQALPLPRGEHERGFVARFDASLSSTFDSALAAGETPMGLAWAGGKMRVLTFAQRAEPHASYRLRAFTGATGVEEPTLPLSLSDDSDWSLMTSPSGELHANGWGRGTRRTATLNPAFAYASAVPREGIADVPLHEDRRNPWAPSVTFVRDGAIASLWQRGQGLVVYTHPKEGGAPRAEVAFEGEHGGATIAEHPGGAVVGTRGGAQELAVSLLGPTTILWQRKIRAEHGSFRVASDAHGTVYAAGTFDGILRFPEHETVSVRSGIYLFTYDARGVLRSRMVLDIDEGRADLRALLVRAPGDVVLAGNLVSRSRVSLFVSRVRL